MKFPAPDNPNRKHLVFTRPVAPNVNEMLADVYDLLGNQIRKLKNRAAIEELSAKDAATVLKYVHSLTLLRAEEEKRLQTLALDGYSEEELKELEAKSQRLLGNGVDTDT